MSDNKKKLDYKPVLVLTLIVTITALVLIIAERGIRTDENTLGGVLGEKCILLMGDGEFEIVLDWLEAGYTIERPKEIAKLIINTDNNTIAFQVITKGYNKDGLNILVVMNEDGSVRDLEVVKNSETPQIGTKVNERSFLENFIGQSKDVRIVKAQPRNAGEVAGITGATKSARGVADAVNIAISTYAELFNAEGVEDN
ncbi:MAG: FMN-binding protein [Oscillospiraceae bacterium]|nr:FMN-binding protein [Oscillospiraceae bacterium]